MEKALTILSSGLDSSAATALAMSSYDVVLAITYSYGQFASKRETECASQLAKHWKMEHLIIDIPWIARETGSALVDKNAALPTPDTAELEMDAKKNATKVWVPGRNALFCAIAASIAEARNLPVILTGFNAEEARTFPDNSKEFVESMNKLFAYSSKSKIRLESPTLNMTKTEIAEMFPDLDVPLAHIWSCYRGGEKFCGECESCVRTIRAFRIAGNWKAIEGRFR